MDGQEMTDQDFKMEVCGALAELKADVRQVKEYQAAQNGRVFQLADKFNVLAAHTSEREKSCPLVLPIAEELAQMKAETGVMKPWIDGGIVLALTLLAILVLMHTDTFLKFFAH